MAQLSWVFSWVPSECPASAMFPAATRAGFAPIVLWRYVMAYLDATDLARLGCVCTSLAREERCGESWSQLCQLVLRRHSAVAGVPRIGLRYLSHGSGGGIPNWTRHTRAVRQTQTTGKLGVRPHDRLLTDSASHSPWKHLYRRSLRALATRSRGGDTTPHMASRTPPPVTTWARLQSSGAMGPSPVSTSTLGAGAVSFPVGTHATGVQVRVLAGSLTALLHTQQGPVGARGMAGPVVCGIQISMQQLAASGSVLSLGVPHTGWTYVFRNEPGPGTDTFRCCVVYVDGPPSNMRRVTCQDHLLSVLATLRAKANGSSDVTELCREHTCTAACRRLDMSDDAQVPVTGWFDVATPTDEVRFVIHVIVGRRGLMAVSPFCFPLVAPALEARRHGCADVRWPGPPTPVTMAPALSCSAASEEGCWRR